MMRITLKSAVKKPYIAAVIAVAISLTSVLSAAPTTHAISGDNFLDKLLNVPISLSDDKKTQNKDTNDTTKDIETTPITSVPSTVNQTITGTASNTTSQTTTSSTSNSGSSSTTSSKPQTANSTTADRTLTSINSPITTDTSSQVAATASAQANNNKSAVTYSTNKIDGETAGKLLAVAFITSGIAVLAYSVTYLPQIRFGARFKTLLVGK